MNFFLAGKFLVWTHLLRLYFFIFWTDLKWWVELWFLTSLGFSPLTLSWQNLNNLLTIDGVIGCLTTECFDSINNEAVNDIKSTIMFDNEYRQWEFNHSTRTAFNCNLCVWRLILVIFRLFKFCHFSYTKCRMKMTVFSVQDISKSLYHYRQLQWTSTGFEFLSPK